MPASYVQTNYNSSTTAGSTSQTATLTATPSVGNTLVVAIRAASSNTVTSVTDSASNTYTLLVSKQQGSASTVLIYAAPIATAPTTITTNGLGSSARPTIVAEFAGLGTALTQDPTDGTGTNGKSNGSATSDTISTAKAINNYGDMVLSAITTASTVTFVPQNLIINPSNNLALGNFLATASVGSTQSFTYNWSPASASADVIATLQPYGNLLQFTTVAH